MPRGVLTGGRKSPTKSLEERQVESTREMAQLAQESGFKNVAGHLTNLADQRKTAIGRRRQKARALRDRNAI